MTRQDLAYRKAERFLKTFLRDDQELPFHSLNISVLATNYTQTISSYTITRLSTTDSDG